MIVAIAIGLAGSCYYGYVCGKYNGGIYVAEMYRTMFNKRFLENC